MEFTFTLTEQEANAVIAGLQELPAKIANPLTQKLHQQAQEQMPKSELPTPEKV
jgi:hypothetical protein